MKKIKLFRAGILLVSLPTLLTSCRVNWFDKQYDVPWWMIAIPVAVWSLAWLIGGSLYIASKKYRCPLCARTFSPKRYRAMLSVHVNGDRVFKCPHCGKRKLCQLIKDRNI